MKIDLTPAEIRAALHAIGQMTSALGRDYDEWRKATSGRWPEWMALLRAEQKLGTALHSNGERDRAMEDRAVSEPEADNDFYQMVNLFPDDTGLPMVVWASERGRARHDVRVKVCETHGTRMLPGNLATVAVRPTPRLLSGHLSAADLRAVCDWIALNEAALVDLWDYRISGIEFGRRMRRLP